MTKFKKCDYCKIDNKTVKKYKTVFSVFGINTHGHSTSNGVATGHGIIDQFYLCDLCFQDLVPPDKVVRRQKIDNDFFEAVLRQKLNISYRVKQAMGGMRHGTQSRTKEQLSERRKMVEAQKIRVKELQKSHDQVQEM